MNRLNFIISKGRLALLIAACVLSGSQADLANAATINISNVETLLSDPGDTDASHYALWAGWATQVYEYNMPFIELSNEPGTNGSIEEFRMTIGNLDYNFANEFLGKQTTNSWDIPANGEYALLGKSTPDIVFESRIEDGGDTLVLDFGPDGLAPGQTVRFQVDINKDADKADGMMFAPFTKVFFTANGGDDISGNSEVRVDYVNSDFFAEGTLPNHNANESDLVKLSSPRSYNVMQNPVMFPFVPLGVIPEPSSLLLVTMGLASAGWRSRR